MFKYLDYMHKEEQHSPEKGQKILSKISTNLREEVYRDFYGGVLSKSKLFRFNFSRQCTEKLALLMNEVVFGPQEIIYDLMERDNRIFFILKGQVELSIDTFNSKTSAETKHTY